MGDEVSRSHLWELARNIVDKTRFSILPPTPRDREDAVDALIGWARSLASFAETIASEAFGPFPVQTAHESLTAIEKGIHEYRMMFSTMQARVRELETQLQAAEPALRAHIHDCPIGWHDGKLLMSRTSTEADAIAWLQKLRAMLPPLAAPAASAPEAWHYSSNEEWFQSDACDSREAAIAEGLCELGLEPGDWLWTGRAVPITPEDVAEHITDADSIVDQMCSYFYDNLGDQAPENEFTATPEQAKELEVGIATVITAWLTKHNVIKSWQMEKVVSHRVGLCPKCDPDSGSTPTCPACSGAGVVIDPAEPES